MDCTIYIKDGLLSRFRCEIRYSFNSWLLRDRFEESENKGTNSLNATWVLLPEIIKIDEEMILKYNHSLLKVTSY
jgi:hypothetical protein